MQQEEPAYASKLLIDKRQLHELLWFLAKENKEGRKNSVDASVALLRLLLVYVSRLL